MRIPEAILPPPSAPDSNYSASQLRIVFVTRAVPRRPPEDSALAGGTREDRRNWRLLVSGLVYRSDPIIRCQSAFFLR